jgi:hypothetical protein
MSNHVLIAGPGRAGTTFLVELLTHLGVDTGFTVEQLAARKHAVGAAGLEHDIFGLNSPYVVKSPFLYEHIDDVLGMFDIDHVFIPLRDLYASAESRRRVSREGCLYGGLVGTDSHEEGAQERILLEQLHTLLVALGRSQVPVTLLEFPRLATDVDYLYHKLYRVFDIAPFEFMKTFRSVSKPSLIHHFER